jgi:hypothetical protein
MINADTKAGVSINPGGHFLRTKAGLRCGQAPACTLPSASGRESVLVRHAQGSSRTCVSSRGEDVPALDEPRKPGSPGSLAAPFYRERKAGSSLK